MTTISRKQSDLWVTEARYFVWHPWQKKADAKKFEKANNDIGPLRVGPIDEYSAASNIDDVKAEIDKVVCP